MQVTTPRIRWLWVPAFAGTTAMEAVSELSV
jgi:hypothetical protein